jgi:DNA repair exonuclease SbcCD ATPase subunit
MFLLVGCADDTEEANKLITQVDSHFGNYNQIGDEIDKIFAEIDKLSSDKKGAERGLELTERLEEKYLKQKDELKSAKEALEKIFELNVKDEFKDYVEKELAAVNALSGLPDVGVKLSKELRKMYKQMKKGTTTEDNLDTILQNINKLERQADAMSKAARELKEEAERFYKEHNLGE